jgi:hypothetical protein
LELLRRVAEIFLDTPKTSAIGELALQYGCPLATLAWALNGRDTGPLAVALDKLADEVEGAS